MRPRRPQRSAAACGLAALAAALAIPGCGDDGDQGSNRESGGAAPTGRAMEATIPAQIDERPHGFASLDVLHPVENAWRASDGRHLTEVDAGALATDRSTGAFVIFRHDFRGIGQDMELVEVEDAGALRITGAPVGRKVAGSAQRSGRIRFAGVRGVRGTLDLRDDTVSLGGS